MCLPYSIIIYYIISFIIGIIISIIIGYSYENKNKNLN